MILTFFGIILSLFFFALGAAVGKQNGIKCGIEIEKKKEEQLGGLFFTDDCISGLKEEIKKFQALKDNGGAYNVGLPIWGGSDNSKFYSGKRENPIPLWVGMRATLQINGGF